MLDAPKEPTAEMRLCEMYPQAIRYLQRALSVPGVQ